MRHSLILLFLFLLCGCTQIKLKSLESNKCTRCKNYLNKLTKIRLSSYSTETLGNLGNLGRTDGENWGQLAKAKFEKEQYIDAADEQEYHKFIEHTHCLIGLDLKSIRSFIPSELHTSRFQTDSTLIISILTDVVKNNGTNNIWIGTKAIRLYCQKRNQTYYLSGSDREQSKFERCISEEN